MVSTYNRLQTMYTELWAPCKIGSGWENKTSNSIIELLMLSYCVFCVFQSLWVWGVTKGNRHSSLLRKKKSCSERKTKNSILEAWDLYLNPPTILQVENSWFSSLLVGIVLMSFRQMVTSGGSSRSFFLQ
jgi:hypothetical protein